MTPSDCDQILGRIFRPMFDPAMNVEGLERLISQAHALSANDFHRRQDRDLFCLDWQKDGVWYTAGLQGGALLFVNMRFEPGQLLASQVIACLGAPQWYQAWYNSYLGSESSSVQVALVYPAQSSIIYCSQLLAFAAEHPPSVDDRLPVTMVSIFGTHWSDTEQVLGRSKPWPGNWQSIEIETSLHSPPPSSDRDQEADALPVAATDDVLAAIQKAFADAPRPADDELLHPDSYDDSDIQALIGVPHWRDLSDDAVEGEYSALAFLGPAGFRHFLPAYMSWALRHPNSGAAVVGATIFALAPAVEEPMRSFMLSKFSLLDDRQHAVVASFLRVMANFEDVRAALDYWYPRHP
jgi:hypothetical protein